MDQSGVPVLSIRTTVGMRLLSSVVALAFSVTACAAFPQTKQAGEGRDATHELEHGGRTRRYHVHVPPVRAENAPLPVMLVFHGGGGNGEQVARSTGFSQLADREGFVVVYPDGTGRLRQRLLTWNCGGLPCYATEQKVDDVGFVRALLADLGKRERVDPTRVYATGMSNGGMMVHRLTRECPELLAAVAPVAGAMNWTEAAPKLPMPILIVHGRADQHVLFAGGKPKEAVGRAGERIDASVAEALAYYRARNGQSGEPERTKVGAVETTRWDEPAREGEQTAPVVLVAIDGEGHTWPGSARGRLLADTPTKAFSATDEIWRFCREQRR